jgi:hypothetical protein
LPVVVVVFRRLDQTDRDPDDRVFGIHTRAGPAG